MSDSSRLPEWLCSCTQLDDARLDTASSVEHIREKSGKLEQTLEWYIRYSKTLSTVLGACPGPCGGHSSKLARVKYSSAAILRLMRCLAARSQVISTKSGKIASES